MHLQIDGRTHALTRVRVELPSGACVRLRCRIAPAGPVPSRVRLIDWRLAARDAVLRYGGSEVPLIVTGFDAPAAGEGLEVHLTPVAAALWSWLGESLPPRAPLALYQRQSAGVDPTGWSFVRRLAGYHLAEPEGSFADRVEAALDAHACFPRPAGWNNLDFLEGVLAVLGEWVPDVHGWCGFGGPGQGIRLVTRPGPRTVTLDDVWKPSGERCRSARSGRDPRAVRWSATRDFHPADPAAMLGALCTRGRSGDADDFGRLDPAGETGQVVAIPVAVVYRDHELFCRRAEYTFLPDSRVVSAELRFGTPRRPRVPAGVRVTGVFHDWVPGGGGPPDRVAVVPRGGRWAVLATRTPEPDPAGRLWTEVLSPIPARGGYGGLSWRYAPGDVLRLCIQPGRHPDLCGHPQHRRLKLERNDVTVNAPGVGIQTDDAGTDPENASGLRVGENDAEYLAGE
jgi:hypothetical protein